MSSRPSNTDHNDHSDNDQRPQAPQTFGQRHGLKILGIVGLTMFITVIVAQVGC